MNLVQNMNENQLKAILKTEGAVMVIAGAGSGKTRTAASIVDILTRYNWVKNILFLADRTALVKQAKNSFKEYLPKKYPKRVKSIRRFISTK